MRTRTTTRTAKPRVALALPGGDPLGAIHEIGALCPLQESLEGTSPPAGGSMAASALWRATFGGRPLAHSLERPASGLPTGIFSERRGTLAPKLARHGITLREDVLRAPRKLLAPRKTTTRLGRAVESPRQVP